MTLTKEPIHPVLAEFLEQAGYSENDVLAFNRTTKRIATRNGGLYEMKGRRIIHHGGPSPDPTERI